MPVKVRLSVDVIRYLRSVGAGGTPKRVEDLAIIFGASKNYLHQVVSMLSRSGMISVIMGPKGGIVANLSEHNLLEIYQLFGYMTEPEQREELPSDELQNEIRKMIANIVI